MHIHHGYEKLNIKDPVVTIGTFDGVHRGHLMVLEILKKYSRETGGESVVITFFQHPRQVLTMSGTSPALLTTLKEKISLLEKSGIDHLVIVDFDLDFSNREACVFVEEILVRKIGARHLIVGFNHHFGKGGEGDFETIKKCALALGLKADIVEALIYKSAIISSSVIRDALLEGRIEEANEMLGYHYFINGTIAEGKKLGRTIGFPTANIRPDEQDKLVPGNGVYAVEIIIEGGKYKGVMSIGVNPTINKLSEVRTIEVNIFRFRKEVYGSKIQVIFRFRLRDEITFSNMSELASQIETDKKRAMALLR